MLAKDGRADSIRDHSYRDHCTGAQGGREVSTPNMPWARGNLAKEQGEWGQWMETDSEKRAG